MKNRKGFTVVEFLIVICIMAVLAVIAAPIYRTYARKAMSSEGRALLSSIQTAENVYFKEFGSFYVFVGTQTFDNVLDVDASGNKYFKDYSIVSQDVMSGYTAQTTGSGAAKGIVLTVMVSTHGQVSRTEKY